MIAAPIAPNSAQFIMANITSALLDLDRWTSGLCPIAHFALRYRVKDPRSSEQDRPHSWITLSSNIKPEYGSMYVVRDLQPATWYELSVTALNDAGQTESNYLFATLTPEGATVEPLYTTDRRHLGSMIASQDSVFGDPMIMIPATCAILVLVVVGAATLFIYISRSKEVANSEHCEYRIYLVTATSMYQNYWVQNNSLQFVM